MKRFIIFLSSDLLLAGKLFRVLLLSWKAWLNCTFSLAIKLYGFKKKIFLNKFNMNVC